MLVKKQSIFTGTVTEMELPITQEQLDRWQNTKELIQDVFPHLTPEQREFLQSGATPEEWDRLFPEEDEDEAYCDCGLPIEACHGCLPNESGFTIHPVTKG